MEDIEQNQTGEAFITFAAKTSQFPTNHSQAHSTSTQTTNPPTPKLRSTHLKLVVPHEEEDMKGLDFYVSLYSASNQEEPIVPNEKTKNNTAIADFDFENKLKLDVRAPQTTYNLNPEKSQRFPVKIRLEAMDSAVDQQEILDNRMGIDLICVVDVSGSMASEKKLNLVQETLRTMISMMTEYDRLALIVFNHEARQIFPLRQISQKNSQLFADFINSLNSSGGTNINNGVSLAMEMIKHRKYKNPITSVFLLSDGQDQVSNSLKTIQTTLNSIEESFTVHSFGFGKDHDADLMRDIAKTRGGNFYFVDDLKTIEDCFLDAMGLLFSAVLKDVEIKVTVNNNGFLSDVRIFKTYGEMWSFKEENKCYLINIKMFTIGMMKDYICVLNLPPIKKKIGENEKKQVVLKVEMTAASIKEEKKILAKTELVLNLLNYDDILGFIEESKEKDSEVWVNLLRVKGAEKIEKAKNYSDNRQYEKAQKELQKIKKQILDSPYKDHPSLMLLLENIGKTISLCQKEKYNNEGKSYMTSYSHTNMYQQSCPYSNVGNSKNVYATSIQARVSSKNYN